MSIEATFDTTLVDGTETDLVALTNQTGVLLGNIFVNSDDDSGSPNGFHSVNSGGDILRIRVYVKDNNGNYKQTSRTIEVDQGQDHKQPTWGDQVMHERDIKVTATLSNYVGDVRITGHVNRVNKASQLNQVLTSLEITRGTVQSNGNNTNLQFDSDLALGGDDVINRAQVSFLSGAAGSNEYATPRDIIDYVNSAGTIKVDESLPSVPSAGDEFIVHRAMSSILRG